MGVPVGRRLPVPGPLGCDRLADAVKSVWEGFCEGGLLRGCAPVSRATWFLWGYFNFTIFVRAWRLIFCGGDWPRGMFCCGGISTLRFSFVARDLFFVGENAKS